MITARCCEREGDTLEIKRDSGNIRIAVQYGSSPEQGWCVHLTPSAAIDMAQRILRGIPMQARRPEVEGELDS